MLPRGQHFDHLLRDLALLQRHPEYLVPEDGFELFEFHGRGDTEHAIISVKAAVCYKNMAVGVESEKITEGLNGNGRAGDRFLVVSTIFRTFSLATHQSCNR